MQITIATRHGSKQFKGWRCLEVCTQPQESPGLGHLQSGGCWELGRVWIRDWIFLWRWGKGLWHAPMRVSPALWSSCLGGCSYLWERIILSPPVPFFLFFFFFFVFISLPLSLNSGFVRISQQIFLLCSLLFHTAHFLFPPFQSTPIPLFTPTPTLSSLCCTPLSFFSFSLSLLFYPSNTWQTV